MAPRGELFRRGAPGLALVALLAAVLLLVGGSQAFADENGRRLIIVTADTPSKIDQLQGKYDVGYIGDPTEAAVYLDSAEEALLRAQGYELGEVVEDQKTWLDRRAEIDATTERERLAKEFAQRGSAMSKGKRIVALPGEVVIMRAYTFTNYAGRFLYVEAHNKLHGDTTGPTMSFTYTSPNGTSQVFNLSNSTVSPDGGDAAIGGAAGADVDAGAGARYMYHRGLFALRNADATLQANQVTVRFADALGIF